MVCLDSDIPIKGKLISRDRSCRSMTNYATCLRWMFQILSAPSKTVVVPTET